MLRKFKKIQKICKNLDKLCYFIDNFDKFEQFLIEKPKNKKKYTIVGVPDYQKKYIQENILTKSE